VTDRRFGRRQEQLEVRGTEQCHFGEPDSGDATRI
jgi:hypothetical protein